MRIWSNKISCLSLVSWTCRWQGGRTGVEGLLSFLKLSYYIEHRAKSWAQFWHTAAFRGDPHSIMFEFPSIIYMILYKRPDCSLANTHFFLLFLKNCVAWTLRSHGVKLSAGQSRVQCRETKGLTWQKKGPPQDIRVQLYKGRITLSNG